MRSAYVFFKCRMKLLRRPGIEDVQSCQQVSQCMQFRWSAVERQNELGQWHMVSAGWGRWWRRLWWCCCWWCWVGDGVINARLNETWHQPQWWNTTVKQLMVHWWVPRGTILKVTESEHKITIKWILHLFIGLISRTTRVKQYQKGKTGLDLNEATDDMVLGMAVASAGPYANNLHLAPDRWPHQHLIAQFLQAICCSWRPTNSIKALKAITIKWIIKQIKLENLHAKLKQIINSNFNSQSYGKTHAVQQVISTEISCPTVEMFLQLKCRQLGSALTLKIQLWDNKFKCCTYSHA